jgi:cytochrome d ubiquinol oxidase subunit II
VASAVSTTCFLLWTDSTSAWALAPLAIVAALVANRAGREGWAFTCSGAAIVATVVTLFAALYPAVVPSTLDSAFSLTTTNAAASPYALQVMTVVALVFTPPVMLYQAWTYWVFRRRIGVQDIPVDAAPGAADRRG